MNQHEINGIKKYKRVFTPEALALLAEFDSCCTPESRDELMKNVSNLCEKKKCVEVATVLSYIIMDIMNDVVRWDDYESDTKSKEYLSIYG